MPNNTKITHPVALDATLQNVASNIRGLSQTLTPAVDANMSTVSTNPVQNKVVTTAVNDKISTVSMTKQDDGTRKLTFTKGNGSTAEYDLSYSVANESNPGLESSAHYSKLEGIASGAEVNQNAFSSFTGENSEVIEATNKEDSIEIRGVNIDIDFNPGGEGKNLISISAYNGPTTDGVTLTAYASGSNAGKIGLAGEALTSDFEYVVCDNLSDYLTVGEKYHIKGCPHLSPSSSDPGLGEIYLIYYNKDDPASMNEVGNKDTGDGIVITHRTNYNRLSIIVKQGTVINTIGGQYAYYFTPKVYQEITKSITFTGNTGGGEDWNVALDGTVDYSKPSDKYLEIYPDNFPYTDEHPEELSFSISQYDLLTNFNDIDINENGSDISQIQIHKGCWTSGSTSESEVFYEYNFKHSHLCPYNNKEYSFYYYAYNNKDAYSKFEIWSDNGYLIFNAKEKKFYVASYGGETYEASLSGDYPDALIYNKYGTRYTYNGNYNIDNGSLFIYNPDVSSDISGINALYNYYSESFPTFKLITDFKKEVMYDYYYYIPYYYPTLSYMLNDQLDLDGNTVHAEFVVKGGADLPSEGDEVLVKRHFYRGAPFVLSVDNEDFTTGFLSKFDIYADEEKRFLYQWFEDDSRVAGIYKLEMHIEYPKFDPYNYLTKDEANTTYLNKNNVDTNMSTVSTNPVQNAVVTAAVNNNISTVTMTKDNTGTRALTFTKGNGSTVEYDLSYSQATDSVLGLVKVNGSTGTSTTDVMSQKAVTDELAAIKNITDNFTIENGELCILVDDQNNSGNDNSSVSKAISLDKTLQEIADTLDGMSENIDSVAASSAAETTTNWLNQHVDPQTQVVIDDSLTISGAAADAKVTGDNVRELKSALTENLNANLFDFEPHHVYYNSSGETVENVLYGATDFKEIEPYTRYTWSFTGTVNAYELVWFDSNKTWIRNDAKSSGHEVSALSPINAKYVRLCFSMNTQPSHSTLVSMDSKLYAGVLNEEVYDGQIAIRKLDNYAPSGNLFDFRKSSDLWLNNDGTITNRNQSLCTGIIPVTQGRYRVATNGTFNISYSRYNASMTFVDRTVINGKDNIAFTVPASGVAFVVISIYASSAFTTDTYKSAKLTVTKEKILPYMPTDSEKEVNALMSAVLHGRYEGKKCSILGDSISTYAGDNPNVDEDGHMIADGTYTYAGNHCAYPANGVNNASLTYWMKIIDALGMTLEVNESWAGSMVGYNPNHADESDYSEAISISGLTRIGHLGSPDVIIVNAGTNDCSYDASHGIPLGTVDYTSPWTYNQTAIDSLSRATFADAYRAMLIRLMYYYPNAEIILMTPNYSNNTLYNPETLDKYCEVIKELADLFGLVLIDGRKSIGMSFNNWAKYFGTSSVHPNDVGMNMMFKNAYKSIMK